MKSVAEVIAEAREYLESHGWIKGELQDEDGRVCGIGAIIYSQGWDDECLDEADKIMMEKAACALGQAVLGKEVPAFNIPAWNDMDEREEQQVLDAFAKAEKIARAGYDPDAA